MDAKTNHILGVRVDNLSRADILVKVKLFLAEKKFHQIATVNAEFILEAQKNQVFKDILNSTALNVADSVSIWYAFLRLGRKLKARLSGADLMLEILRLAEEKKLKIFLAVNKAGLSSFEETRNAILKKFPGLEIFGANLDKSTSSYQIRDTKYNILLCNFGAPFQELFINSQKCDTIQLAMGVGGAFDFSTGKVRRAPIFMRKLGLEWLWRLILQPHRWKRIFRAVIIFPIRIVFNR